MTTTNPFPNDPDKAEVFDQGYSAGFMDPDGSDFLPLAPDLLEVYQQGFQAGRGDKSSGPSGDGSQRYLSRTEAAGLSEDAKEGIETIEWAVILFLLDELFETGAFSFLDVVELALSPGGDTQLGPLPPDFRAGFNVDNTDPAIHYLALCPRSDHTLTSPGVTNDGHWTGQDRNRFEDALSDMTAHEHSAAFIVRCNLNDNTCGPVWLTTQQ
ncbi:MAG: hypothetical protein WBX22_09870 [Silvibacterium sp.]